MVLAKVHAGFLALLIVGAVVALKIADATPKFHGENLTDRSSPGGKAPDKAVLPHQRSVAAERL